MARGPFELPIRIGQRDYTYIFEAKGSELTGRAKSVDGDVSIVDGRVDGKMISFFEKVVVQGRDVTLQYSGELIDNDKIRFKRWVANSDFPAVNFEAVRVVKK
jgi:hypothetical protein